MLTHNRSRSPIKKLFNRLHSLHTYVNYHKTHNMATCFGGVGNAPVEEPRTQDTDNGSESESLDEDLMRHVLAETANIKQFVEEKYREPREAIHEIEQRLNDLSLALCQQHTPIKNVLDRYTETLCMAQKKTSLENTLLQDIPILNGQDSSQLEDWLTDIETAAELTNESRTKLVQAKSWGLVRTLISEDLIAQKSWDEIKDSLHLKISNADIHTSISLFMDIQQTDKESLATYVHRFKREANRCKFDTDTTTIRIFLKGLKNAYTLVTKVYEKGPPNISQSNKRSREVASCTTINFISFTRITSKCYVKWSREMFSMPRSRPYGMLLPPHQMLWLWQLWSCSYGLPWQNSTIRHTSPPQAQTQQKEPEILSQI